MESEVGNHGPLGVGRFAPDKDFAIIGGGCEDGTVFGVCLALEECQDEVGEGEGQRRTDP